MTGQIYVAGCPWVAKRREKKKKIGRLMRKAGPVAKHKWAQISTKMAIGREGRHPADGATHVMTQFASTFHAVVKPRL